MSITTLSAAIENIQNTPPEVYSIPELSSTLVDSGLGDDSGAIQVAIVSGGGGGGGSATYENQHIQIGQWNQSVDNTAPLNVNSNGVNIATESTQADIDAHLNNIDNAISAYITTPVASEATLSSVLSETVVLAYRPTFKVINFGYTTGTTFRGFIVAAYNDFTATWLSPSTIMSHVSGGVTDAEEFIFSSAALIGAANPAITLLQTADVAAAIALGTRTFSSMSGTGTTIRLFLLS